MNAPEKDPEPIGGREDEAFLSRWSRRKQASDRESDRTPVAGPEDEPAPTQPPPCDADMPPIESLDEESDFRGFLSPEVSDELHRLALRKLFHAPTFNVRDGLDDYDEDLTQFAKLGGLITADLRHQLERVSKVGGGQAGAHEKPGTDQPHSDELVAESGKIGDETLASSHDPARGEQEQDPEQRMRERPGS